MSYDKNIWNSIKNELKNDKIRQEEMKTKTIKCQNNQSLRFYDQTYGKAGPSGFCLFICLHGGGQGSAEMNDNQWKNIIPFENGGFQPGTIAVAPRGITNSWNLHFVQESFPAITRLVENYIIFKNVDPNKVYLMGFSAGGDGTYSLSERIPYLFAACSPQAGHPNGVSTINLCNLPTYLAAGQNDTSFKRNEICVEYYNKILGQNGKYCGNYIAKVEVVADSGHSFKCWSLPRKSFFNGAKNVSQSKDTAFNFMYSHTRNPNPKGISCDVKTFLTSLRNYYTQRGNSFYNIEIGKNPCDIIQLEINYGNNTIHIKEGKNFRINLVSSLFKKGNVVTVNYEGKNQQYELQKDQNYAKNNMKLYCDPNFGYDSFINIGDFQQEVKLGYVPKPPSLTSASPKQQPAKVVQPLGKPQTAKPQPLKPKPAKQQNVKPQPPKPQPAKPQPQNAKIPSQTRPHPPQSAKVQPPKNTSLPNVNQQSKNSHNPAQYLDKGKNGKPYYCVKLGETDFSWSNDPKYWVKINHPQALMGKQLYHLNQVFYIDPKAHFYDIPKANYFLLLRHNPSNSVGLDSCTLTIKVNNNQIYSNKIFKKNYKKIGGKKNLIDEYIKAIKAEQFKSDKNEVYVEIKGEKIPKKNWDLDGFILIQDTGNGKIETIYNQYFNLMLVK